jgi:hypothetical protein
MINMSGSMEKSGSISKAHLCVECRAPRPQVDGQSHVVHSEEEAMGTRLTIDSLTCLLANEVQAQLLSCALRLEHNMYKPCQWCPQPASFYAAGGCNLAQAVWDVQRDQGILNAAHDDEIAAVHYPCLCSSMEWTYSR